MGRLGLIVRLLVGALVNTLIVLALLASAAVVLLWIIGRNKQLQARRQQCSSAADASPCADGRGARLGTDPPTPFGSTVSPVQDVPPRRLSFSAGQSGPGLGLRPAPAAASHGTSASAPPLHSTPTVGPGRAGVAHAADAGARATPASSSRRVSFLLTPEQERRVSTGGSLCDSGNGSDPVPSSPRVVVTRAAGQPVGASKAAEAPEDGAGASGPGSPAEYEPMDTSATSPMPRSSLKGSRSGGQSSRRASFGGEITRRPIRKASSASVLSSSAATAVTGGAGPLPRRQLDPRLFKSVSMEWTPQNGPASTQRTLVQRGSGAASGESVDKGVLFEDSTDGRRGTDDDDGGSAGSGNGGGGDLGDGSDGVDEFVNIPSNEPAARLSSARAAGSSNAAFGRPAAGNTRQRRVMGGSIQKPNSSSTAIAAIAAARRVRLLRGSPPGTMPVPLPRSLSSTGNNPDPSGTGSLSTAAWERNRRVAAARVSRMLADADAAETAAAAVASQSRAHSRAAVAAEAAAASVRAQAVADETELAAQSAASVAAKKQTAPPVPSLSRWESDQQTSSSLGGRPAASSTLFQPLDQSQQPQRVANSSGPQPGTEPRLAKRRARDGGFSGASVAQVDPSGGGLGPSRRAGLEAEGPSFQSVGRTGPHVPPSFSMGAPASSRSSTFDVAAFSAGGAAVESRPGSLPTRSSGAPSFTPTTTLLAAPNGSTPTDGPDASLWRPSPSQPSSQLAGVSFGAPTPRSGAGNNGGGSGGASSFTPPSDKGLSSGPARATGNRPGGGSFGDKGFGTGLGFDGGGLGVAPPFNTVGALSSGDGGASAPSSTSGAPGGLKRSPSQLALEGSGGSGGAPKAAAASSGFGNGGSLFGRGAPPASAGSQGGSGDAAGAGAARSFFSPPSVGTGGGFAAMRSAAPGAHPPAGPSLAPFAASTGDAGRGAGPALGAAPAPFSFGLPSTRLL